MATLFPSSYLSTASQPWGREVEKRLVDLKLNVDSNEVNNSARDQQLAASYKRLDKAVNDVAAATLSAAAAADKANEALAGITSVEEAVYYPGTTEIDGANIRASTIAANKLSAGTITGEIINGGLITGATLRTAASGERVEIGVDTFGAVSFFSPTAKIGSIYAAEFDDGGGVLNWVTIDSSYTYVSNYMSVGGNLNVNNSIYAGFLEVDSDSFTVVSGLTSTEVRSKAIYDAGTSGAVNLHIQGSGYNYRIYRNTSASTREIKRDIRPLEFDQDAYIGISPVVFKYVDGILREEEKDWDVIGFIAEDFVDAGFSEHLVTQPQGEDEYMSLRYDKMYMFLHGVVKSQQETIKDLTSRLETLENK